MPLTFGSSRRFAARAAAVLRAFLRDDRGQDLIEYAFLAGFVGIAGYLALGSIAPAVSSTYASWIDPDTGSAYLWEPADAWTSSGS